MSLSVEKTSQLVLNTSYQVRGVVYLAATERIQQGKEVIFTSVGNPQALGQPPLTFIRQVMALVAAPFLMDGPVGTSFPSDVVARAKEYLGDLKSLGAYTDSRGSMLVRSQVAKWLEQRDNLPSRVDRIFLTDGASVAVRLGLQMLIRGKGFKDGILVPIPQYPLYSAGIALLGGHLIPYELDEDADWGLNVKTIQDSIAKAKSEGIEARGLVFINPGNPTGQQLTESDLAGLLRVCHDNHVTLLADEVYQDNVYEGARPFISARSVLAKMLKSGGPDAKVGSEVQLLSFHTASKGACGECGMRGGMVEITNVGDDVVAEMYKLASINLSPNVPGQVALGCLLAPPQPGDPSYALFQSEKSSVIASLGRRAAALTKAFKSLPGVECVAAGSMYCFPKIQIPPAAIAAAKSKGIAPDVLYCLELLDETGIAVTPGSGFGKKKDGSFHFRTTILVPEEKLKQFADSFISFHNGFIARYGGQSKL